MNEVKVQFLHPINGSVVDADLDLALKPEEAIEHLIDQKFLDASPGGYKLAIKGGATIPDWQTFREAGVGDGTVIRAVPQTDAGRSAPPHGGEHGP